MDLERQLADALPEGSGTGRLEDDFIRVAKAYGEWKGITYPAWREMGVVTSSAKEGRDRQSLRIAAADPFRSGLRRATGGWE